MKGVREALSFGATFIVALAGGVAALLASPQPPQWPTLATFGNWLAEPPNPWLLLTAALAAVSAFGALRQVFGPEPATEAQVVEAVSPVTRQVELVGADVSELTSQFKEEGKASELRDQVAQKRQEDLFQEVERFSGALPDLIEDALARAVAAAPRAEGLFRARVAELLRLEPAATAAAVTASLESALNEREAFRKQIAQLAAEDNRITGLLQAAEEAKDAGRSEQADELLAQAEALHEEREFEHRAKRFRLITLRAFAWKEALNFPEAIKHFDRAAALAEGVQRWEVRWLAAVANLDWSDLVTNVQPLSEAVDRLRELVPEAPDDYNRQITWGFLAGALAKWGGREEGVDRFREAVAAYTEMLAARPRDKDPVRWATARWCIGEVLIHWGEREAGLERWKEAEAAIRDSLEVFTSPEHPQDRALSLQSLGSLLVSWGSREKDADRVQTAVAVLEEAKKLGDLRQDPIFSADLKNDLGGALLWLGQLQDDVERLHQAVVMFGGAADMISRDGQPLNWAMYKSNLAGALYSCGELTKMAAPLEQAIKSADEALEIYREGVVSVQWAMTMNVRGQALRSLGEVTKDCTRITEAISTLESALGQLKSETYVEVVSSSLNSAREAAAKLGCA